MIKEKVNQVVRRREILAHDRRDALPDDDETRYGKVRRAPGTTTLKVERSDDDGEQWQQQRRRRDALVCHRALDTSAAPPDPALYNQLQTIKLARFRADNSTINSSAFVIMSAHRTMLNQRKRSFLANTK